MLQELIHYSKGHDLEYGTNCLAPYLLTILLEPILIKTATELGAAAESVRIVWVTSMLTPGTPPGGMQFETDGTPKIMTKFMENYMGSKNGSAWLAAEFGQRLGKHGILSNVRYKNLEDEKHALIGNRAYIQA